MWVTCLCVNAHDTILISILGIVVLVEGAISMLILNIVSSYILNDASKILQNLLKFYVRYFVDDMYVC